MSCISNTGFRPSSSSIQPTAPCRWPDPPISQDLSSCVNGHSVDFSHDGGGLQDHALNHLSALARVPCPPQLECSLHFFYWCFRQLFCTTGRLKFLVGTTIFRERSMFYATWFALNLLSQHLLNMPKTGTTRDVPILKWRLAVKHEGHSSYVFSFLFFFSVSCTFFLLNTGP
jgi:hypothetical protein